MKVRGRFKFDWDVNSAATKRHKKYASFFGAAWNSIHLAELRSLNRISEKKDALNFQRILFLPTHGCCNSPLLKGISYDLLGPYKNVLKRLCFFFAFGCRCIIDLAFGDFRQKLIGFFFFSKGFFEYFCYIIAT